jgi:hypothetical protein
MSGNAASEADGPGSVRAFRTSSFTYDGRKNKCEMCRGLLLGNLGRTLLLQGTLPASLAGASHVLKSPQDAAVQVLSFWWRVLLLDTKDGNPNHYIVLAVEQPCEITGTLPRNRELLRSQLRRSP